MTSNKKNNNNNNHDDDCVDCSHDNYVSRRVDPKSKAKNDMKEVCNDGLINGSKNNGHAADCTCSQCYCADCLKGNYIANKIDPKSKVKSDKQDVCNEKKTAVKKEKRSYQEICNNNAKTGEQKNNAKVNHDADCTCLECICTVCLEEYEAEVKSYKQNTVKKGIISQKICDDDNINNNQKSNGHDLNCSCSECYCMDCMKGNFMAKNIEPKTKRKGDKDRKNSTKSSHGADCDCPECCVICLEEQMQITAEKQNNNASSPVGKKDNFDSWLCQDAIIDSCHSSTCDCHVNFLNESDDIDKSLEINSRKTEHDFDSWLCQDAPSDSCHSSTCDCHVNFSNESNEKKSKNNGKEKNIDSPSFDSDNCSCEDCAEDNLSKDIDECHNGVNKQDHEDDCLCPKCLCIECMAGDYITDMEKPKSDIKSSTKDQENTDELCIDNANQEQQIKDPQDIEECNCDDCQEEANDNINQNISLAHSKKITENEHSSNCDCSKCCCIECYIENMENNDVGKQKSDDLNKSVDREENEQVEECDCPDCVNDSAESISKNKNNIKSNNTSPGNNKLMQNGTNDINDDCICMDCTKENLSNSIRQNSNEYKEAINNKQNKSSFQSSCLSANNAGVKSNAKVGSTMQKIVSSHKSNLDRENDRQDHHKPDCMCSECCCAGFIKQNVKAKDVKQNPISIDPLAKPVTQH
ncbi:protein PFC0760c-like [Ctenocephalides felis]|uniref:protein PFC0760c-like n=1 Tax=Ctenocephalides felis TaxID=7515 RepID=UPI000E6E2F00|nr:protein PFC0760c-like [Ctenocephalides felis]